MIASSPTDLQPVLDVVAENASRLCEANDAAIRRADGDKLSLVASPGQFRCPGGTRPRTRLAERRAFFERQTVHVHDLQAKLRTNFLKRGLGRPGDRTFLVAPMLREGNAIGAINIRRTEVRPFTEKQIALLKTFADQAVIAIENVRLFKELERAQCRIARGPGASDGNGRGARHHQPLAHGRAAGPGRDRRERRAGLWDR